MKRTAKTKSATGATKRTADVEGKFESGPTGFDCYRDLIKLADLDWNFCRDFFKKREAFDAAFGEEEELGGALGYGDEEADFICDTFKGALTGPARWVYESLTDCERRHVAGCYRDFFYNFSRGLWQPRGLAKMAARYWAENLSPNVLNAASRKEFERQLTEGEEIEVSDRDGKRTVRHRSPGVMVCDVERYHWGEWVAEAGLVLDEATSLYCPPEVRDRMEAERKRETAEREERERAELVGRAALAALPVAPVAPEPALNAEQPKRKRGRPKQSHSTPQARSRARAAVEIVEYAAERPELTLPGAADNCAAEHGREEDYQYFTNYENMKSWGQRHGIQFSRLVDTCRNDPEAWKREKERLTS